MVAPYTAVGLVTTVWGIRHRPEIRRNLDHISHVIAAASWLSSLDLRTEQYRPIYQRPIYPKNLYADRKPFTHAEFREQVIDRQIEKMHELGIWAKPGARG